MTQRRRLALLAVPFALVGLTLPSPAAPAAVPPAEAITLQPGAAPPQPTAKRLKLRVLLDDSYPPYTFRTPTGELQGILPDLWALWSKRTGIAVELVGGEWGDVQRRFNAGEGDVLDTAFHTAERDRLYLFSAPYAKIEVPIIFDSSLSGIRDAASLRGFTVGVKDGDACIEFLGKQGIDSLKRYPSYEAMIAAAARSEIRVACIDRPPATYYLLRMGVENRFRASPPLYSGEFHWVVRQSDEDLRDMVTAGFYRISARERQHITEHWLGEPLLLSRLDEKIWQRIGLALLMATLIGGLLLVWVATLRRQVAAKTRDLTSALANLSANEFRFRTLFDSINDAIFLHDIETGRVQLTNRRAHDLFGYEQTQALTLADISAGPPPFDSETALHWIRETANGPQMLEWLARHRDGRTFWIEVDLRRVVLDDTGPQVLAVLRDITERKESEEKLTRTIDALTRSNTDLERFAYAASHDLREPLTTLVRYAQLLERRFGERDPQIGDLVGIIVTAAKQMMRLVEGLLEFSQVDAAGRGFTLVEANRALTVALGYLDIAIQESGATVTASPLPMVGADEIQLIQLFQNLIGNAIKYRDINRPLQIKISAQHDGDFWDFTIADNGIGIESAYLDQIFVIFKRLHSHGTIPGVGIGLALCKRIVERHGGQLWAESTPGIGTKFHFTLPAP